MLGVDFCGVKMKNPLILASGFLGVSGEYLVKVAKKGAGAVTFKSVSLEAREGHKNPTVLEYGFGIINAVGLSNAGAEDSVEEIEYAVKNSPSPVIASIFGSKVSEYGAVAKKISEAKPHFIEANISCPNVEDEFGKPFASDPKLSAEVVKSIKENTDIPLIVKLSPNVSNIGEIAKAVEQAGGNAINMGNTLGPGMIINIEAGKPVLANKVGGVSGPAIKPIAVKCVYDVYKAVKIPIIGTGGITNGLDAIEMIMAGAACIGIGSGIYYRGIEIFKQVCSEMEEWMKKNGYKNLDEIRGKAHE